MPTRIRRPSEGIFVFAPGSAPVAVGDVVRVRGTVGETFGRTAARSVTHLAVCPRRGTVTATQAALPVAALSDWEPREGMLVTFPQVADHRASTSTSTASTRSCSRAGRQITSRRPSYEPGSAEAAALAAGERARPDHARRRPQRPEPGPGAPPGRRGLRPRQPLPRRRHARRTSPACSTSPSASTGPADRRAPTTPRPTRARRSRRRRRQRQGRLVQRAELLHDVARPPRPRRRRRGGVRAPAGQDHRRDRPRSTPTSSGCSRSRTTRRRSRTSSPG